MKGHPRRAVVRGKGRKEEGGERLDESENERVEGEGDICVAEPL